MIESSITFLPASDLEETTRFYTQVIGLPLLRDMGACRIFSCGEGAFGFCRYDDGRPMAQGVCLSLNLRSTEEVDELFARVRELGTTVLQPPQLHPNFPVYSCFLRDPNGYTVELQKIVG